MPTLLYMCVCVDTAIVNLIWLNVPGVHTKQNLITFNLLLLIVSSSPSQIIIPDRFTRLKRPISSNTLIQMVTQCVNFLSHYFCPCGFYLNFVAKINSFPLNPEKVHILKSVFVVCF